LNHKALGYRLTCEYLSKQRPHCSGLVREPCAIGDRRAEGRHILQSGEDSRIGLSIYCAGLPIDETIQQVCLRLVAIRGNWRKAELTQRAPPK